MKLKAVDVVSYPALSIILTCPCISFGSKIVIKNLNSKVCILDSFWNYRISAKVQRSFIYFRLCAFTSMDIGCIFLGSDKVSPDKLFVYVSSSGATTLPVSACLLASSMGLMKSILAS